MATGATPNLDQFMADELAKIKAGGAGEDGHAAEPQSFKVVLGGQEQTFTSMDELQKSVNAQLEQARKDAAEARGVAAGVTQLAGQHVTAHQMAAAPEVPKPDLGEFAKLLEKDVQAAFNYVDRFRFGTDNVAGVVQQLWQRQQAQEQVLAAYQFRENHPEYARTAENAQALQQVMQTYQMPLTYDNLEMAYALAQQKKLIHVGQTEEGELEPGPTQGPRYPSQPTNVAPPSVGRRAGGDAAPDYLAQAEDMEADQLAALISKFERGR
jgi:hypothetical protein